MEFDWKELPSSKESTNFRSPSDGRSTTNAVARLSSSRTGLHEDDLVGHALGQEPWEVLSFPAIAEADEVHAIETIWGPQCFARRSAEHPSTRGS